MGSFAVFKGEGDFDVRIEFDSFAARLIKERKWHSTQEILETTDGRIELRMKLNALEEVERWVLSWGSHAKVIGPPQLRARIRKAVRETSEAYANMPIWFREYRENADDLEKERLINFISGLEFSPVEENPDQMRLALSEN